jgi:hypothetical protein
MHLICDKIKAQLKEYLTERLCLLEDIEAEDPEFVLAVCIDDFFVLTTTAVSALDAAFILTLAGGAVDNSVDSCIQSEK